ncbi:uncharacterized protein K444DRAFT_620030 [Hyaloscypha bicolor E]|uniref:Uncharacterized protein n=1 Tax=Hyaloscypha bicolor E TaxID=1095630 RepID=A0A2J6SNT4_9HELO|nr:uncharacterized protein K444DRAFT_620030 [Hyaloscypha bicolor E]PMD52380.1 hypothetical protein K444DRAFT_620030 [Hyaloscypha bicolor E]
MGAAYGRRRRRKCHPPPCPPPPSDHEDSPVRWHRHLGRWVCLSPVDYPLFWYDNGIWKAWVEIPKDLSSVYLASGQNTTSSNGDLYDNWVPDLAAEEVWNSRRSIRSGGNDIHTKRINRVKEWVEIFKFRWCKFWHREEASIVCQI